jgi:hypothetical protein
MMFYILSRIVEYIWNDWPRVCFSVCCWTVIEGVGILCTALVINHLVKQRDRQREWLRWKSSSDQVYSDLLHMAEKLIVTVVPRRHLTVGEVKRYYFGDCPASTGVQLDESEVDRLVMEMQRDPMLEDDVNSAAIRAALGHHISEVRDILAQYRSLLDPELVAVLVHLQCTMRELRSRLLVGWVEPESVRSLLGHVLSLRRMLIEKADPDRQELLAPRPDARVSSSGAADSA